METVSIALICTLIGTCLGYLTYQKKKENDTKEEGKNQGITEVKLDYISRGIDDIKIDMRVRDKKMEDMNDRLIKVEESTKSAHHRIDGIEEEK